MDVTVPQLGKGAKYSVMIFEQSDSLALWLATWGVDMSLWGKDGNKTAVDLWLELHHGDCIMQGPPPLRVVRVVQVVIQQGGKVLIEAAQEMSDGRLRSRRFFPSEKMKPGEPPAAAALRCLHEELGVALEQVVILSEGGAQTEKGDSPSYPGLQTEYHFVEVAARIRGLSDQDFWHENLAHALNDPVKRHHWTWVQAERHA
ncbi:MAG: NUDIX domain-containing protein [Anaerolineae bacterium]|nr:NUDIX domain-containing protein [Anaerolineae bacterium]